MRVGLRTQLLVPILGVIFLSLGFSGLYSFDKAVEAMRGEMLDTTGQLLGAVNHDLTAYLQSAQGVVKLAAGDEQLIAMFAAPGPQTRAAADKRLKEMLAGFPAIVGANLVDLAGTVVAASDPKEVGTLNVADREYFQRAAKGETNVSQPFVSKVTGKPVFFWLIRRILVSFKGCVDFAGAMAGGDLSRRLNLAAKDEVGDLGNALDGMADAISRIMGAIQQAADEMSRGHLRKQLDVAVFGKDYKPSSRPSMRWAAISPSCWTCCPHPS